MKFVHEVFTKTLEVKQSKFIAFLLPYSKYNEMLSELKTSYPKARHFVVAYRYLNEYNQIVEHSSDDGEPKGTSGKPSLFVLQGADIINSAVIIVRYFGGTKLGTGGLVRAYSDSVNLVLEDAELFEYQNEITKEISFWYSEVRLVEYECGTHNITIVNKVFDINVFYTIKSNESDMERFLQKVQRVVEILE